MMIHHSVFYYKHHRREDITLRGRVREIANTRVRYGHRRICILQRREGWRDNHKHVYRVYKEEGLNLRSKRPRRNKASAHRLERPENNSLHQCWSMDFVSDAFCRRWCSLSLFKFTVSHYIERPRLVFDQREPYCYL